MLKIIKPRTIEIITEFWHEFTYEDDRSEGFSFRVDKDGNVITESDLARKNYELCKTGRIDGRTVIDEGVYEERRCVSYPTEGRCVCGQTVVVDGIVECDCGRWYNSAGQELVHPLLWEEDC